MPEYDSFAATPAGPAFDPAVAANKLKWGHFKALVKAGYIKGLGKILADAKKGSATVFGNKGKGAVFTAAGVRTKKFESQQVLPKTAQQKCYEGWVQFNAGGHAGETSCRGIIVAATEELVDKATFYVSYDHYRTFKLIADGNARNAIIAEAESLQKPPTPAT